MSEYAVWDGRGPHRQTHARMNLNQPMIHVTIFTAGGRSQSRLLGLMRRMQSTMILRNRLQKNGYLSRGKTGN